jgi:hypothetical protein
MGIGVKLKHFFDSLGFNIVMSIVSLLGVAKNATSIWATGEFSQGGVLLIIWLVLAFHFVKKCLTSWKARP